MDDEKTITVKCDQVKKFFRVPETVLWQNEAARHFAGIIARREYGRRGFCMTTSFVGNGVVQAFIGTPAPGGGCSGHQVIFGLEVVE